MKIIVFAGCVKISKGFKVPFENMPHKNNKTLLNWFEKKER